MTNKSGGLLATPLEELQEIATLLKELDEKKEFQTYQRGFLEGRAVEITREMSDHPKWWNDYPCYCHECATCG